MKILAATLIMLGMLAGTSFAANYYVREGYGGTVLSTDLNSGSTTFFTPTSDGYLGTDLD